MCAVSENNPTFCWNCGKPLERRNGELVSRAMIYGGETHRVHVTCVKNVPDEDRFSNRRVRSDVRRYLGE